ncbi:hypothetical protein MKW94_012944 [Papaver nudicaule]|uniref:F-box/LRR-repeat protein 15-like leucin rich repeat domain-containing protein n=1 Tax=Papaver nudicaule TaxID=74823 RepID=A0AA41VNI4_PAPNU|nr:hypothetical protein [Papaver nudicaule]
MQKCSVSPKHPRISLEIFTSVVCMLLVRFQNLQYLSLSKLPKITDFVTLDSHFFGSKVHTLGLGYCTEYSDVEFSLIFSWFPCLRDIDLIHSSITDEGLKALECCPSLQKINLSGCRSITDKGLESLAKCCSSLKEVRLSRCRRITDSGISYLIQNCCELHSLSIDGCNKINGTGFQECPKTLTHVEADKCRLQPEGIKAIVSGGGLEFLSLESRELAEFEVGSINTRAVITISKGCPLLKELILTNCEDVQLEGWDAIGRNCENLERLTVYGCKSLCDQGLQALDNGCNKLSKLCVDNKNNCRRSTLERFKRDKPEVMIYKQNGLDAIDKEYCSLYSRWF